jgi:diaminopimelate decarboxylase
MKHDLPLHPDNKLTQRLLQQTSFGQHEGELSFGGVAVRELVERYGSPLYAIDAETVLHRHRQLVAALAGFAQVYFSIKANPQPAVAALLVAQGAGLEVASGGELLRALAAKCPPHRILFAGPAKGREELAMAVEHGIGEVHLENYEEIAILGELARWADRKVMVALRINPSAAAAGGAMRMGGKPAAFGFDEETIEEAMAAVAAQPFLHLDGLHVFAGTQVLDAQVLRQQWTCALTLAVEMGQRLGRPLQRIDLGGGLGIPYHPGQTELDLVAVTQAAAELAARCREDPWLQQAQVLVEPGRWLVGPAGVYLMRVRAVKQSRGQRFVMADGGMHHHLAASGNLGQVIKLDYPLVAATRMGQPEQAQTQLAGPLCTPLDTLGRQTALPELAAGDVLAVLQSGAYGLSASPVGFLSHAMPAEVLVQNGKASCMRRAGSFEQPLVNLGLA